MRSPSPPAPEGLPPTVARIPSLLPRLPAGTRYILTSGSSLLERGCATISPCSEDCTCLEFSSQDALHTKIESGQVPGNKSHISEMEEEADLTGVTGPRPDITRSKAGPVTVQLLVHRMHSAGYDCHSPGVRIPEKVRAFLKAHVTSCQV